MSLLIAPKNSSGYSKNMSKEPPWVANDRAAAGVHRLSSENKAVCAIFNISISLGHKCLNQKFSSKNVIK